MAQIRAFAAEHIDGVAKLHRAVFRPDAPEGSSTLEAYTSYLTGVFLSSPLTDPSMPSLVCINNDGRIVGFMGVSSRSVVVNGRRLRAAVSSQFAVAPGEASGLVAVRLAKAFLEGSQDLSIADSANDAGRGIWEKLGGKTDRLLSLHWTRPLRPARLALSFLRHRRTLAPMAMVASPLATLADEVAARVPSSHFAQAPPASAVADLDTTQILAHEAEIGASAALRVEHDERSLTWLLKRASTRDGGGRLRRAAIERDHQIVGWYMWFLDPNGTADVIQLAADSSSIDDVLNHLFYDAWRAGAVAVTGRLEPEFMQALSDKYCLFHRRGPWTLVHSKRPELLYPFWNGNASFSRLDGEWSLAFSPDGL